MPFDAEKFGKRLNRCRKARKISSNALGEAVEVNASHIRQIERGNRSPSMGAFINICNQLEVTPDELLIDSLGLYAHVERDELAEKIAQLSPYQLSVVKATVDALLCESEE